MHYWKQLISVLIHKWYVLKAGLIVGNIPLWKLIIHDISKFSFVEFANYASHWHSHKPFSLEGWSEAWLHHMHNNSHHPEYWLLSWRGNPTFYDDLGDCVTTFITTLPMPEVCVREMIADWMGASKVHTGSYDISEWFNKNGPDMILHSKSLKILHKVMYELGYIKMGKTQFSYVYQPQNIEKENK